MIVSHTVKTEIIETGARTSRISSFGFGGEITARRILQPSAETTDLTRRGNSNVLAPVSIISVFTVILVTQWEFSWHLRVAGAARLF